MADSKPKGGRPKSVAEFHEGPEAGTRFAEALKAVLRVSREKILELERQEKKPVKHA